MVYQSCLSKLTCPKYKSFAVLPTFNRKFKVFVYVCYENIKTNLHYSRGIAPKRVTSGGAHLRGLASGQHSSEETSQRWRAVGDTVPI